MPAGEQRTNILISGVGTGLLVQPRGYEGVFERHTIASYCQATKECWKLTLAASSVRN